MKKFHVTKARGYDGNWWKDHYEYRGVSFRRTASRRGVFCAYQGTIGSRTVYGGSRKEILANIDAELDK